MKGDDRIEEIIEKFNRTELKDGEKIIDNSTTTIAREMSLPYSNVNYFIDQYLNEKFKMLNEKRKLNY